MVHQPVCRSSANRAGKVVFASLFLSVLGALGATGCARVRTPTVRNPGQLEQIQPGVVRGPDARGPIAANATVLHVSDGDTIVVAVQSDLSASETKEGDSGVKVGTEVPLRLIGIDTPESKKPNTPVECFAKEAATALELLLPKGTPVTIEIDVETRDRYNRLLGYVFRSADGLFVNYEMARTGMATSLVIKPNLRYTDQLREAADAAESNQIGLWSACAGAHEPAGR